VAAEGAVQDQGSVWAEASRAEAAAARVVPVDREAAAAARAVPVGVVAAERMPEICGARLGRVVVEVVPAAELDWVVAAARAGPADREAALAALVVEVVPAAELDWVVAAARAAPARAVPVAAARGAAHLEALPVTSVLRERRERHPAGG